MASMTSPRREIAQRIAEALAARVDSVEAVCLFGSVARGDDSGWSDIDLIVIGGSDELAPGALREELPQSLSGERLSLIYYSAEEFDRLEHDGGLFLDHLRDEGIVLFDRTGQLGRMLSSPPRRSAPTGRELEAELARLRPYEDLSKFNDNFLFCFSHLYSIGKAVVIFRLAMEGVLEFNRERAFEKFRDLRPELAEEVDVIARLRPFYSLVTRRKPEPLPFPFVGTRGEAEAAVSAIKALAE